jgi:hypothetical protein
MLSTRCLKDLRIWLPQWVSPASHLTLPKIHLRDSHCSAVNAHLRRWWHKQTAMAFDRHRSEALSPTVLLSSPSSFSFQNNFVRNCWRDDGRNCEGDDHYLDPIKVSRRPVPSIIVTGIIRAHPHTNYIQDIIGSKDGSIIFLRHRDSQNSDFRDGVQSAFNITVPWLEQSKITSRICSRSIVRVRDSETPCQELRLACSFHYFQPYGAMVAKYSGHLLCVISWYLQEIQELNCSPQPAVEMTCRCENGWPEESCCCQVELLKAYGTMKTFNYKSCKEYSVTYTQL